MEHNWPLVSNEILNVSLVQLPCDQLLSSGFTCKAFVSRKINKNNKLLRSIQFQWYSTKDFKEKDTEKM